MTFELARTAGVVCDMDGVLWLGDEPLPGLREFFAFLHKRGIPYVLATNNSAKTPADYVTKLAKMGVDGVGVEHIITSGTAALSYLTERYPAGTPVNLVGGAGLRKLLEEAGYVLVERGAKAVIVGLDPALTYDKLKFATFCLRDGANFIATNDDAALPTPDGFAPGAGSIVAALKTASDREPIVIGKPHRPMFDIATRLLGTPPETTLMIGDRLNTDIAGAVLTGLSSALLLTGITDGENLEESPVKPDGVYRDLAHLVEAWERAL